MLRILPRGDGDNVVKVAVLIEAAVGALLRTPMDACQVCILLKDFVVPAVIFRPSFQGSPEHERVMLFASLRF
jgi:hypothetical protein